MNGIHKISYITSHKGNCADLRRCLLSVKKDLESTDIDYEHIITIDGGDTNEAEKMITGINDRRIIVKIQNKNIGKSACFNRMLKEADGNFIFFLDSDDQNIIGRSLAQCEYLAANPHIDCCGCNYLSWYGESHFVESIYPKHDKEIKEKFFMFPYLLFSSIAIRSEVLKRFNIEFDENIKAGLDYEFYSRLLSKVKVANLQKPLCIYKINEKGITRTQNSREAQLNTHKNVLRKLFSLENYDANIIATIIVKMITSQARTEDYRTLRKEIKKLKKALDTDGKHNYFPNYISSDKLKTILSQIAGE